MSLDISGLGHAIVDLQFKIETPFLKTLKELDINFGSMTLKDIKSQQELLTSLEKHYPSPLRACGGSATNSIIAASSFGANCHYSCKVSNDNAGNFYKTDLIKNKVINNISPTTSHMPSGQSIIMVTPDAERTMCTCLGISETLSTQDIDSEGIKSAKYLLIEGYLVSSDSAFSTCLEAIKIAKENQTKIAFSLSDSNIVSAFHDQIKEIINTEIDIIFCNASEAIAFTKEEDIFAAELSLQTAADKVFITKGSKGASVWDGTKLTHIEGFTAKAIDTNGAGDMFAGAVLYSLINRSSFSEAARFACFAASKSVEFFGPRIKLLQYDLIKSTYS